MDKKIDPKGFEAYAVKALKLTAEEVASLYSEAGELNDFSLLERKDADRIKKLSDEKTGQYNRGLKEAATKLERELKEKHGIESELIGVELVDFILEQKVGEVKKAGSEDILKHPEVIRLISEHGKALKLKDKELKEKLDAKEQEINRANLLQKVKAKALAELENLKPILPEDAKKATNLKNILIADLEKNGYQENGEEFIVLKEDGTPLQDAHANNVSFSELVKGTAEKYFDFKKADDRSSAGNNNGNNGNGTGKQFGPKVRTPKDQNDFLEMSKDNTLTPEERIEINNRWQAVKNNTK